MNNSPNIEHQEKFYDGRWANVEFINHAKLGRCVEILNAIASLRLNRPQIIELGCGTGWLTSVVSNIGPSTGVELSSVAVAQAKARYPHADFMQANLIAWSPPRNAFDLVVSHEVLEHLEDQARHFELAHQLLRPGGHLVLTTPNKSISDREPDVGEHPLQPIENWVTKSQLRALAEPAFAIVRLTTIRPYLPRRGLLRFVSYYRLRSIAEKLGLRSAFERLACAVDGGYHLLLIARKR